MGCIDVAQVSPHDRIVVLQAQVRQRSHYDAEAYRSMASVVDVMEEDKLQCFLSPRPER